MKTLTFELPDENATIRFAEALEKCLPTAATVVLQGTLGAGKTRLVQAFAAAAGVDPHVVTSPTFILCQHYEADRLIHHVDAYRLRSGDEFLGIGGMELLEDDAICFLEWGERIAELLPEDRLEIAITITGDTSRTVCLMAFGQRMQAVLERLAEDQGESR